MHAHAGQLSLAIIDVTLPDAGGFVLCRPARSGAGLPVTLLTASATESGHAAALGPGAEAYLAKPYSPGDLLARIKTILRRRDN